MACCCQTPRRCLDEPAPPPPPAASVRVRVVVVLVVVVVWMVAPVAPVVATAHSPRYPSPVPRTTVTTTPLPGTASLSPMPPPALVTCPKRKVVVVRAGMQQRRVPPLVPLLAALVWVRHLLHHLLGVLRLQQQRMWIWRRGHAIE